ncbi:ARM repeat-containing protein [Hesseltinella vesiculosa]|uniref:ARM repeat-containing protein n=1 Tax=Hesseltinella vesiculosa TaxID=101127 RepID=A0A1X2GAZ8_9FUNG|nr:ARM repeat-containing protein [Hesseltinella vesiculosa]
MTESSSIVLLQQQVQDIITTDDVAQLAPAVHAVFEQMLTIDHPWPQATELAEYIGNAVRIPARRGPLAEADVIAAVAALMKQPDAPVPFLIQALRILGNICIDRDEIRQRVLASDIIPTVVTLFKKDSKMDMFLAGFCMNTSMDYEPIQQALVDHGVIPALGPFLKTTSIDTTETMVLKTLDNLTNIEQARTLFADTPDLIQDTLALFVHAWKEDDMDDLDAMGTLADIVLQVILENDTAQALVARSGYLEVLIPFLDDAVSVDDKEDEDKLKELKNTVGKIIVYATSGDELLEVLYKDETFMNTLFSMLSGNERMTETSVYIIGNLARTDDHCVELVQRYALHERLLAMFNETENALTQSGMLGCLRHLCIPKQNRGVLGEAGLIDLASPFLAPTKDLVKRNQFIAVTILKLLASEFANAQRMLHHHDTSILDALVAFFNRIDDVGAKSETTRVYIQLIKTVWLENDTHDLRLQLVQPLIIRSITELIRTSKFPVLKNDGYIALTVIFADHESDASKQLLMPVVPLLIASPSAQEEADKAEQVGEEQIAEEEQETRSFLQVASDDLVNDKLPKEIRGNVATFFDMAIRAAYLVNDNDAVLALKEAASTN